MNHSQSNVNPGRISASERNLLAVGRNRAIAADDRPHIRTPEQFKNWLAGDGPEAIVAHLTPKSGPYPPVRNGQNGSGSVTEHWRAIFAAVDAGRVRLREIDLDEPPLSRPFLTPREAPQRRHRVTIAIRVMRGLGENRKLGGAS